MLQVTTVVQAGQAVRESRQAQALTVDRIFQADRGNPCHVGEEVGRLACGETSRVAAAEAEEARQAIGLAQRQQGDAATKTAAEQCLMARLVPASEPGGVQVVETRPGCLHVDAQNHVAHDVPGGVGVGGEQIVDHAERVEEEKLDAVQRE